MSHEVNTLQNQIIIDRQIDEIWTIWTIVNCTGRQYRLISPLRLLSSLSWSLSSLIRSIVVEGVSAVRWNIMSSSFVLRPEDR